MFQCQRPCNLIIKSSVTMIVICTQGQVYNMYILDLWRRVIKEPDLRYSMLTGPCVKRTNDEITQNGVGWALIHCFPCLLNFTAVLHSSDEVPPCMPTLGDIDLNCTTETVIYALDANQPQTTVK